MLKLHRQQAERRLTFRYYHRRAYARDEVFSKPITLLEIPRRDWDFFHLCFCPEVTGEIALIRAEPEVNLLLYSRYRVSSDGLLLLHRGRLLEHRKPSPQEEPADVLVHLAGRIRELVAAAA